MTIKLMLNSFLQILDPRRSLLATSRSTRFELERLKQAEDHRSRHDRYLPTRSCSSSVIISENLTDVAFRAFYA